MKRRLTLPESYQARIEACLESIGYSLKKPDELAAAVLRLSDHYNDNPDAATPWKEAWVQAASLAYFFPLNYSRARAVAAEGQRLGFFEGLDSVLDFGAGHGSATHAVADELSNSVEFLAEDISPESLVLAKKLSPPDRNLRTKVETERSHASSAKLLLASYVLTELKTMPDWWTDREAILLIEPSIQSDARRLQAQREVLMAKGLKIWAPCTHEQACPLLVDSEKDWCHDRIHFEPPAWFTAIENKLPMKNRTITFSYVLARRTPPPANVSGCARMIGDPLVEKGKTRQAVCRGPQREFLAWFPQRFAKGEKDVDLDRGDLVSLKDGLQKKSNELRLTSPLDATLVKLGQ